MKISKKTTEILKNFATINQSILLTKGSQLKTITPSKTIMSVAEVPDSFPKDAAIYDISRFLSVCSLYTDPDIDFGTTEFTISEGNRKTRYAYADPSMIVIPPDVAKVNFPAADVVVNIKWDDFNTVMNAATYLQLPEIAFVGEGGKCFLKALKNDVKNTSSDSYSIELSDVKTNDEFVLVIKLENLKIMPLDYEISLSSKGISKFSGDGVIYYIPVDQSSKFKKN